LIYKLPINLVEEMKSKNSSMLAITIAAVMVVGGMVAMIGVNDADAQRRARGGDGGNGGSGGSNNGDANGGNTGNGGNAGRAGDGGCRQASSACENSPGSRGGEASPGSRGGNSG
jgi:hypothetical protein